MHKHEWKFDVESGPGSVYGQCECGEYMSQQMHLDWLDAHVALRKVARGIVRYERKHFGFPVGASEETMKYEDDSFQRWLSHKWPALDALPEWVLEDSDG